MKLHYLLICAALVGCAKEENPLDTQQQATQQQIVALQESLPPECKTAPIIMQFEALAFKTNSDYKTCKRLLADAEDKLDTEKQKVLLLAILFAIATGLFIIKVIRK